MVGVSVLGAGGHGRDVAAIVRACGWHFAGFLDDGDDRFGSWDLLTGPWVFGVHDSLLRARRDRMDVPAVTLVHPSAYVEPGVEPDAGAVVGPRATIGPECRIGRHVHVGQAVSMVRTVLADYATVSPGAVLCGDVQVGRGATVGAGAVVSNLCTIGACATIGAGAVLPPRTVVPAGSVWAGVPARPLQGAA